MTINKRENSFPSITPDDGKMLTNGIVVVDGEVYLRSEREVESWREVDNVDDAIIIDEFDALKEILDLFNEK